MPPLEPLLPCTCMYEQRFASTPVDRALERLQRAAPTLTRLSQALAVALALLLALFDVIILGVSFGTVGDWLGFRYAILMPALVAISVLAVGMRRRHQVAALVVVCLTGIAVTAVTLSYSQQAPPSFTALFAIALLTTGVVRVESASVAGAATVLGAVAVAFEAVRVNGNLGQLLVLVSEACFAVAVAAGAYLRWSDWRRQAAEAAARTDERLEIARELHDLVGHYVTGMVVQAQAARHVADRNPAAAGEALERIEVAGGEAMTALRRMVGGLRHDTPTAPGAAWEDIEQLVAAASAEGVPVRLRMDPAVRRLSADLSASAFRIVTESLTNVRRHARDATCVDVDLEVDGNRLRIRVADDGTASGTSSHDTYGLVGMSERAAALGGTLYAGPAPSKGWLVLAELPLEGPA